MAASSVRNLLWVVGAKAEEFNRHIVQGCRRDGGDEGEASELAHVFFRGKSAGQVDASEGTWERETEAAIMVAETEPCPYGRSQREQEAEQEQHQK